MERNDERAYPAHAIHTISTCLHAVRGGTFSPTAFATFSCLLFFFYPSEPYHSEISFSRVLPFSHGYRAARIVLMRRFTRRIRMGVRRMSAKTRHIASLRSRMVFSRPSLRSC